jgi:hypothetical protein
MVETNVVRNVEGELIYEIYSMKFNETIGKSIGECTTHITRVPGGWLWNKFFTSLGYETMGFIPYSEEFKV